MIKKTAILIGIFWIGALYGCKDEDVGKASRLHLTPNPLYFEYQNDTIVVTSARAFEEFGRSSTTTLQNYFSNHHDTLYDGWIKAVASEDRMQIKVIVYENYSAYNRYYEIDVMGGNNGDIIRVIQRTNDSYFVNPLQ